MTPCNTQEENTKILWRITTLQHKYIPENEEATKIQINDFKNFIAY
jgi:hypothetical protein